MKKEGETEGPADDQALPSRSHPPYQRRTPHLRKACSKTEKPIGLADYELTQALPSKLASSLPSIEAELSHFPLPTSHFPLPTSHFPLLRSNPQLPIRVPDSIDPQRNTRE